MRRLRWLWISGATIVFVIAISRFSSLPTSSSLQAQTLQPNQPIPAKGTIVPPQIVSCIPAEGAMFDVLGTVSDNTVIYHLLSIYEFANATSEYWDALIQSDAIGCLLLHHLGSGLKPLSTYIPIAAARNLELQRYRFWIAKAGSKAEFQRRFTARAADPKIPHFLPPEQVWALQQLDIQIPKTYKILNSRTGV
ncbi:hypothetical protein H6F89_29365 [Cyanobacteria bacterium FACHB-63]|nr:hypothetical protein [Cyanobacteria bacterium FACHB-63]